MIGGDVARRRAFNRRGMRVLLPSALRHGVVLAARRACEPEGVLIANPPGRYPFPRPGLGAIARAMLTQGPRVLARWATVFRTLDDGHPTGPHWYLATLGVREDARRRGLGRSLLDAFTARVDAGGLPAWVETDRERNVHFYEGAGFRFVRRVEVLGVPVFCLERPARVSLAAGLR